MPYFRKDDDHATKIAVGRLLTENKKLKTDVRRLDARISLLTDYVEDLASRLQDIETVATGVHASQKQDERDISDIKLTLEEVARALDFALRQHDNGDSVRDTMTTIIEYLLEV